MSSLEEPIWFEEPKILIDNEKRFEFIPVANMSFNGKLNSMLRFSAYFAILWYFYDYNISVFIIPLLIMLLTYMLYNYSINCSKETFENELQQAFKNKVGGNEENKEGCTAPTKENPFMNVLMNEYIENPNRAEACENSQKDAKEKFEENLYKPIDEIWDKDSRQFYTNPSTTIPNDAMAFARWCNEVPASCKENSSACVPDGERYQHGKII